MKKVGLVGFGFIGSFIYESLKGNKEIMVAAVWEPVVEKIDFLNPELVCETLEDLGSKPLDLIVEAAHTEVVKKLWPHIKSGANLMISSLTSLSDPEFRCLIENEAKQNGQKIFLPHAAILGLDGLRDGRKLLSTVSITTTKHPVNLGMPDVIIEEPKVIFNGSTLEACKKFPRNVNVHAAIALAGIGFEKTESVVIADPRTNKMQHRIQVEGKGLSWNLEIESFSAGKVTGSYTPESICQSVIYILSGQAGFRII